MKAIEPIVLVSKLLNSILGSVGLELRLKRTTTRQTLRGTLEHAKLLGFEPKTVIDVGAGIGTFELYETFPKASHMLIEPLEENRPYLEAIVRKLEKAEYIIAAATRNAGTVTINIHRGFFGSSIYSEYEGPSVDGTPRIVPAVTLDEVCLQRGLRGPYLIKVDVQGAELDVILGASEILKNTEYVVLEVSLLGFLVNGPQLYDVVAFMKERGFVVYDLLDYSQRPLDGAMSHLDMAFVPQESGMFRKDHSWATRGQRDAVERRFNEERKRALQRLHVGQKR
jgi:FkbM family methyltransferase